MVMQCTLFNFLMPANQGEWPFWPACIYNVFKSHVEVVFYEQNDRLRLEKMDIRIEGPQKQLQKGHIFPYAPHRSM
jgi:hypothetical protein